jgi:transposase
MEECLRFVAPLLDGETMSEVCRAFGIARKTGYKIFARYREARSRSGEVSLSGRRLAPGTMLG